MSDILKDLNPEQKKAVTTTKGPLLIIAGAGTGKTTVIARRIAYLIEEKLAKPSEILALTFTDKAAAEMEERVDVLVPYGYIDTWISTFHSFGDRILRECALEVGLSPDFRVLSKPQQILFFEQNLFRFNLDYYRPLGNPAKFISAILAFFSRLKDENIIPEEFNKYVSILKKKAKAEEDKIELKKYQELSSAYETYEDLKNEAGFLDFGDQVVKIIDLFKRRPKILKDYQARFKYILVDEYQDTNFAQNELVKMLSSSHKNICVVGDDDQSIYKFRGAAISNILEFQKVYKNAENVVLTQNYRSTQAVLDSAYKLISHNNPDRLEIKNNIDKKLKSQIPNGRAPQELFADKISEEADLVASTIEKLMAKSVRHSGNSERSVEASRIDPGQARMTGGYSYKDFAVLVRANSQADHFLRAFNMKGIPHKFIGSSGLYSQPEVALLISFLSSLANFEDSLNLFNLATSDIYELSAFDAVALSSYAKRKNRSLWKIMTTLQTSPPEDLSISSEGQAIVQKIVDDLSESLKMARKENVGRVTFQFLKNTGYLTKLERESSVESQIKIQNVAKFFDKIKEFTDVAKVESVFQFVDYLEALRGAGDDPSTVEFDPDLDAVNIMTVHGAKGLEFKVVFMVALTSDRFPSRSRGEVIEVPEGLIKETLPEGDWHIQEERRLFYVGVTRAKELLYFTWSRDVGGVRVKKISPFVLEAMDKLASSAALTKLSPLEKIEKFAPTPPKLSQQVLFDTSILRLTQGSIDDYLTCAYKYRYMHVLGIPILRHHAVAYGAALHAAIAQFLQSKKQGKVMPLTTLLEIFDRVWDSEGFLTIEHEEKRKAQGKVALTRFWDREVKSKEMPAYIEKKFDLHFEDVLVVGRFDRVDIENGDEVTIIDYKSSDTIDQDRADAQAKESIQLAIYALYWFKMTKKLPQSVQLHFLENGLVGRYEPTEKDMQKTEKLIIDTAQKIKRDIKTNTFVANPKYFGREPACTYCAYNSICPFSLAK